MPGSRGLLGSHWRHSYSSAGTTNARYAGRAQYRIELPWTALAAGTAGSPAANIATAHPDHSGRINAGWPAVALLIAIKPLSGILEHRATKTSPRRAHRAYCALRIGGPGLTIVLSESGHLFDWYDTETCNFVV